MSIKKLTFSKDWTDPNDFPTVEESEEKVRADLQALHNETRNYINTFIQPLVNELDARRVVTVQRVVLQATDWALEAGYNPSTGVNVIQYSQRNVPVTGVKADPTKQIIQPVPEDGLNGLYYKFGIRADSQSEGALKFVAAEQPNQNLGVYVVITEVLE